MYQKRKGQGVQKEVTQMVFLGHWSHELSNLMSSHALVGVSYTTREPCHGKTDLKIFVVVIPKEGLAGISPLGLLLVTYNNLRFSVCLSVGISSDVYRPITPKVNICYWFKIIFKKWSGNPTIHYQFGWGGLGWEHHWLCPRK